MQMQDAGIGFGAALGHGQECAGAESFEFLMFSKFGLPAMLARQLLDALAIITGREFVRRQGGEKTREIVALRLGDGAGVVMVRAMTENLDGFEARRRFTLLL